MSFEFLQQDYDEQHVSISENPETRTFISTHVLITNKKLI